MIDRKLVQDIYYRHGKELLVYICGFVKIRETAEDLLHDAFVRLIRHSLDHQIDESNLRAFLYRIARNTCIDYLRKNRKKHEAELHEYMVYGRSASVQEDIEYGELKQKVAELVDSKDPVSRSVFIMRTELNMTYDDIAGNLGISERTAQRKMKDMLKFLTESLEKGGFTLLFLIMLAVLLMKIVLY